MRAGKLGVLSRGQVHIFRSEAVPQLSNEIEPLLVVSRSMSSVSAISSIWRGLLKMTTAARPARTASKPDASCAKPAVFARKKWPQAP